MLKGLARMRGSRHDTIVVDDRRRLIHAWQDRFRDPALTVLLILEICAIFLTAPLAAKGLPIAQGSLVRSYLRSW